MPPPRREREPGVVPRCPDLRRDNEPISSPETAPVWVRRAKDRIRAITRSGRGRNIERVIDEVNRFTRGWVGYYCLAEVA